MFNEIDDKGIFDNEDDLNIVDIWNLVKTYLN